MVKSYLDPGCNLTQVCPSGVTEGVGPRAATAILELSKQCLGAATEVGFLIPFGFSFSVFVPLNGVTGCSVAVRFAMIFAHRVAFLHVPAKSRPVCAAWDRLAYLLSLGQLSSRGKICSE